MCSSRSSLTHHQKKWAFRSPLVGVWGRSPRRCGRGGGGGPRPSPSAPPCEAQVAMIVSGYSSHLGPEREAPMRQEAVVGHADADARRQPVQEHADEQRLPGEIGGDEGQQGTDVERHDPGDGDPGHRPAPRGRLDFGHRWFSRVKGMGTADGCLCLFRCGWGTVRRCGVAWPAIIDPGRTAGAHDARGRGGG